MHSQKVTQSNTEIPTVQDQKAAVGEQLKAIKDSVTTEMVEKAAKKAGIQTRTAKDYLKGSVAFLHRGKALYNALLKEIEKTATVS